MTSRCDDVIQYHMKAQRLARDRIALDDESFVELVIWELPRTLAGSTHPYKYRLALVSRSVCILRCDNEAGKGDHKHLGETETVYSFSNLDQLRTDFLNDVKQWRQR